MTIRRSIGTRRDWIIAAAIVAVLVAPISIPRIWRTVSIMSNMGEVVTAITETDCSNHGRILYTFEIKNQRYDGETTGWPHCASIISGQLITVYYDLQNPKENTAIDPYSELWNEIEFVAVSYFIFPPIIMWLARWLARRERRS